MDERRRDAREQILERQPLAQGIEGVTAVLGVAEHDRPVPDAVERRTGVHEQQHLAPGVAGVAHEHTRTHIVVAVTACQLGHHVVGVVGMQELDQAVIEHLDLFEPEQHPDRRADIAHRGIGRDREHDVADLRQRLVELHPTHQRAEIPFGEIPRRVVRTGPVSTAAGLQAGGCLGHGLILPSNRSRSL